jgi:hypothetical protein
MPATIDFPTSDEYGSFYDGYVQRARGGEIVETLTRQMDEIRSTLGALSEAQAMFRPGPAEWSIKEVLGHINDSERIFFYRTLCVSRNEQQPLPGFDQDEYVQAANFDEFSLAELIEEFILLRQANLISIRHLTSEMSLRRGTASGHPITTRALVHILAGHVYHHLESLQTVYLPAL